MNSKECDQTSSVCLQLFPPSSTDPKNVINLELPHTSCSTV